MNKGYIERFLDKICISCENDPNAGQNYYYAIFRILFGLMFLQHGFQKLFGAFGGIDGHGSTVKLLSLLGLAGLIEFFAGIAITFGLFTRLAAFIAAVEMLIAYFLVHFSQGFYPIQNKGEAALMYMAAFILMAKIGNGKWSLERLISKTQVF